jgi:hypothetical protein
MTTKNEYERIGKLIYSACRHGADVSDVRNWMADDLGVARPTAGDEPAQRALYTAFFAKYVSDDEFQANHARFIESMRAREL